MKIARTARFKKSWKQLTEADKTSARKAIANLAVNLRYPALRVKKVRGTGGIWEARASYSLRITFQVAGDTIVLRNIGPHDKTLQRP